MGTLQKLKAYFGMVPADEYDGYDLDDLDDPAADYRSGYRRPEYLDDEDDYDPYPESAHRRPAFAGRRGYRDEAEADQPSDAGIRSSSLRPANSLPTVSNCRAIGRRWPCTA